MIDVINDIIASLPPDSIPGRGDGWVNLADLGSKLRDNGVDFRSEGYEKLRDYVESFSSIEMYKDESRNIPVYYARNRDTRSTNRVRTRSNPYCAMTDWAFWGHFPSMLSNLKAMALPEDWQFGEAEHCDYPILSNYLRYTFYRVQRENKIVNSADGQYAVFNTGLVNNRYESIFALFKKNTDQSHRQLWYLVNFCVEGQNRAGKTLVDVFDKMPDQACYFERISDLFYDWTKGVPVYDAEHVIEERIERFPFEFLEEYGPTNFEFKRVETLTGEEKKNYYEELRNSTRQDEVAQRRIKERVDAALQLAIKRTQWNYKTAIPMYYPNPHNPQEDKTCLLLPLCLTSENHVDAAMVVTKATSGRYQGETIYPLTWAYRCARLICRPDSDWLSAKEIRVSNGSVTDESEEDSF